MHRASQSGDGARDVDEKENTVFISLPVPYEMKYLVENEIIPKVVKEYERPYIIKTILTWTGRKLDFRRIEAWENSLQF
jgi:nicotinamide-nucleotide amidase